MTCMRRAPDDVQKRAVLAMVVKTLAGLHGNGIVHGALSPSAVVWHSRDNAMKLGDLCCAATPGELMPISPTLRYAPPEVGQQAPICSHLRDSIDPLSLFWRLLLWLFT